jgi:hypothetical protein
MNQEKKQRKKPKIDIDKIKVELLKIAKPNCKRCHGVGYIGVNQSGKLVICRCAWKKLMKYKIEKEIEEKKSASQTGKEKSVRPKG